MLAPITYSFSQCVAQRLHDARIPVELISGLMQEIRADPGLLDLTGRWNDTVDKYPDGFRLTVWVAVHSVVTRWLEQHRTTSWFRQVRLPDKLDS